MVTVQVSITGVKETQEMMKHIGRNIDTMGFDVSKRMGQFIQKSARQRSRKWRWTGTTEQDINYIEDGKKVRIVASAPWMPFRERGFRPHKVSTKASTRIPGLTIADWMKSKHGWSDDNMPPFITVRNPSPNPEGNMILPAIREANKRFPELAKDAIDKGIMKGIKRI